ncbi:polyribonucleotide nucleotidyltransferase [Chloroflexota bacterium]
MTESQSFNREIGARDLIIETGKLAGQASAAVTVRYGDSVILVTACTSDSPRAGVDFLPLTIDYEERLYAAGKIPGGFIRREGRPSQEATLSSRQTDRSLRPLLPKWWRREIQIVITVLSVDQENDPDILSVIGGSTVLALSEIPFDGPISAIRVGYIDGELVLNPTMPQLEQSLLDLVVVSTRQAIVMVEAGASEVSEEIMARALRFGHEANQPIIDLQIELQEKLGKAKVSSPAPEINPEIVSAIAPIIDERLAPALNQTDRAEREQALHDLRSTVVESQADSFLEPDIIAALEKRIRAGIRGNILNGHQRVDGRHPGDVRPISCEVGLLPRTHGSALFNRGQTQVLTIATLGPMGKSQPLDGLGIEDSKHFIHHYNFPRFSTGEVGRVGSPGRREIGHGALAERAILPVLPSGEDFPYAIRLVSEVLSSNGSTSMASTCASSLCLMDAGIPIKTAVAGVAMGLITGDNAEHVILTDIAGIEDAYGDMDCKVAGTENGITAMQMDIKLKGISPEIIIEALARAREARLYILGFMQQTINANRPEVSRYAPRMYKLSIDPSKIGAVIGTGGKTIRAIIEETKATVDIDNDGTVVIGSPDEAAARRAIEIIEGLTKEAEIGTIYTGKVTRIMNFGAFVEILPSKEGLVHVSELADYRVDKVEDIVKVGDEITVKVIDIDDQGKIRLSRRAAFENQSESGAEERGAPIADYPFKSQPRSGPPRRRPGDRPRY